MTPDTRDAQFLRQKAEDGCPTQLRDDNPENRLVQQQTQAACAPGIRGARGAGRGMLTGK
jgi:hypothetical protein